MAMVRPIFAVALTMIAGILDFLTAFFIGGFIVAIFAGSMTGNGFKLEGSAAICLFALIIAYYAIGNRMFGGTLWKHLLGLTRR